VPLLTVVALVALAIPVVLAIVGVTLRAVHAVAARPSGPSAEVIELRAAARRPFSASRSGT
jgi:hypothetical protein